MIESNNPRKAQCWRGPSTGREKLLYTNMVQEDFLVFGLEVFWVYANEGMRSFVLYSRVIFSLKVEFFAPEIL